MPTYASLVDSDTYQSKFTGSAIEVVVVNEADPSDTIIGATTGANQSEDFESVPVEEAGNDGVDEHAQGRHSGTISIPAFWTPQWNDTLPSRQSFIGKRYTIFTRIAPGRPNEGTVLNVWVTCTLTRHGQSFGARGSVTLDLAFAFTRRYKGTEWAAIAGG